MSSSLQPLDLNFTKENTLYETPAKGVFITQDGEIRHTVLAHETVQSLDTLAADVDGITRSHKELQVGNIPLSTLSKAGEPDLGEILGISKEFANSLKLLAQGITVISVAGTAVSGVISAMKLLGIFGAEENPYDELYEKIELRLQNLLKSTLAGQTLQTMQQINMLLGHSETAGSIAGAYKLNNTPENAALLPQADYWSQYAVNTLRGEPMWLRTYDEASAPIKVGGSNGWQFGPQVRPDLLMWDWRLPMLAYCKALASRIVVIHTIDPSVNATHENELLDHARFLQTVEQRIRAGFSRSVPLEDQGYDYWNITCRDPCGVVDVQSGASDFTGGFCPAYWFRDEIDTRYAQQHPIPTKYEDYIKWYNYGVEARYWRLYDSLGLFALWTIIPDVQTAAKGSRSFGKTKQVLNAFNLTALTASTGFAQKRIEAYTRWLEKSSIAPKY